MLGKRVVVAALAGSLLALSTVPAAAEQFSQGRTEGGTAYGVKSDLTLRRPGLAANQFYDLKVGARYRGNSQFIDYAGYRARPDGSLWCMVQQYTVYGYDTAVYARNYGDSNSKETFELHGKTSNSWSTEGCGLVVTTDPTAYQVNFDTVLVRSYTVDDGMYLSSTAATNAKYQHTLGGLTGDDSRYALWGAPNFRAVTSRACGYFPNNYSWVYGHNGGC